MKLLWSPLWESLWVVSTFPSLSQLEKAYSTPSPSGLGTTYLALLSPKRLYLGHPPYLLVCFSLSFGLRDVSCGLRAPVRECETSWHGGKLFICSFLMGQHKAGSFLRAPSGPSKST